jgi:hypothetical protein
MLSRHFAVDSDFMRGGLGLTVRPANGVGLVGPVINLIAFCGARRSISPSGSY